MTTIMNLRDVAEVEELSETEFTDHSFDSFETKQNPSVLKPNTDTDTRLLYTHLSTHSICKHPAKMANELHKLILHFISKLLL